MKLIFGIAALGLAFALGGVAALVLNEDNVLNGQIWNWGFRLFVENPVLIWEEATTGANPRFFGGILAAIAGSAVCLSFALLGSLVWGVKASAEAVREIKRSAQLKKLHRKTEGSKAAATVEKPVQKGPTLRERFKEWQEERQGKKRGFADRVADLEEDAAPVKGPGLFERLKGMLPEKATHEGEVVIQNAAGEKIIIEMPRSEETADLVMHWFDLAKKKQQGDREHVLEAIDLVARLDEDAHTEITERSGMQGEFVIRMLKAWANHVETPEKDLEETIPGEPTIEQKVPAAATQEQSIFEQAIADVESGNVAEVASEEEGVDLEAVDFDLSVLDEAIQSKEGSADALGDEFALDALGDDGAPDAVKDGEESLQPEGGGDEEPDVEMEGEEPKSIVAARVIMELERLAEDVRNGSAFWEDEYGEEEARSKVLEAAFADLRASLDEDLSVAEMMVEEGDLDPEILRWMLEAKTDLFHKIETLRDAVRDKKPDEDEDDLDVTFSIGALGPEEKEASVDEGKDPHPDEQSGKGPEEDISGEALLAELDGDMSGDDGSVAQDDEDARAPADDADELTEVGGDEDGEGIEEEESFTEAEVSEPKNLSLPELDEIEKSGEALYRWGHIARQAGASEAKLAHTVLEKNGLIRKAAGIVHLVARWKSKDGEESRKMNLLMRYIPDGTWRVEVGEGVKIINEQGDFVEVSAQLMASFRGDEDFVVVHLYGPGAPEEYQEEEGNLIVVSQPLEVSFLQEKSAF